MKNNEIKPYKKEFEYSYTIGASPVIEMLKEKPDIVEKIFIHSKFIDDSLIKKICGDKIEIVYGDKIFTRLNINDNSYILGIFKKYKTSLSETKPHIMLVNPGDMGNLGSIIRTVLGFGYTDLAVITPAADIFNPKTVRASMGAVFKLNFSLYDSLQGYREKYPAHKLFPFMLDGNIILTPDNCFREKKFTLIFGNEAGGLDASYHSVGETLKIPQSDNIDSLNLSIAVGIGSFIFALKNDLI